MGNFYDQRTLESGRNPKKTWESRDVVNSCLQRKCKNKSRDAFFIGDLNKIALKNKEWKGTLANIKPFYSVRCNPHRRVLKKFALQNSNFICTTKDEIGRVLDVGVSPTRIILNGPAISVTYLRYARQRGVNWITVDSEGELHKIHAHHPYAMLILCVRPDLSKDLCQLGQEKGCQSCEALNILLLAKSLNLDVIGMSFHVGCLYQDTISCNAAISDLANTFTFASEIGFDMRIVDIGGSCFDHKAVATPFPKIANVLVSAIERYFPSDPRMMIIAEPSRWMVASAFTLVVNVIAKRTSRLSSLKTEEPFKKDVAAKLPNHPYVMYYVNDGLYGSFNSVLYDHASLLPHTLKEDVDGEKLSRCKIWGPTCDGLDLVLSDMMLPEIEIGDWLYFENMGAFTMSGATKFNGMPLIKCIFIDSSNDI